MRRMLVLFIVLAFVAGMLGGAAALLAARDLRAARSELTSAKAHTRDLELDAATRALEAAERLLERADGTLGFPPLRIAARIPFAGRSIRAVDALTAAAMEVVTGAREALAASDLLPADDGLDLGAIDWPALAARARRAADSFDRAATLARKAPASFVLGPIAAARDELLAEVADARSIAETLARAAGLMPGMIGSGGDRRHLVVIQNGAEARATGGALEAAMLLGADDGSFDLLRTDPDETVLGRPGDPDASHSLNLDPDFPTVAGRIQAAYRARTGVRADTVIALDTVALARLLEATGPVEVDGIRLTGNGVVRFLSRDIFDRYPSEGGQGAFLGAVSAAVWQRLVGGRIAVRRLLERLGSAAAQKHVMMWSRRPAEQRVLAGLGIAGVVPSGRVIGVIGNNAGGAELDWFARRSWSYRVRLDADGTATAALALSLANRARLEEIPAAVRAKQPRGRLFEDVRLWAGRIATRRLIAGPGAVAQTRLEATFPTTPGTFEIIVFRQPGLRADRVSIEIEVPAGTSIISATPGMRVEGAFVRWAGQPESDLTFHISYG